MTAANHHVAVLGASSKPDRYANQAVRLLLENHYRVTPIHPKITEIENLQVASSLKETPSPVDTLTLYVGPARLKGQVDDILSLAPKRVIFNPGTEFEPLEQALSDANIPWIHACTLVLLKTNVFLEPF